ncbi:fatty acid desaturase [Acidihalobacter ferrooxydans]|uniref:Acyl-CoA desaturase n=1 Tax=Acidihalobacter ferrooxydans TaxID=1765967 RepID=A0A1P8UE50_9GAMM|nr:fatty acid desaturase [Acidihalobacter ferrooxydans]APZ42069.1 acyl-CoA desaturase [Acidihalobacter ferrooxydans]
MLYGLLDLPWWGYVLVALALTHVTIVSVTLFLHRAQAHRALEMHPALAHFFRFWLWLTTGMITREWVAVHRKHHAKCETAEDPHSPHHKGIGTVLWQGAELYGEETARAETVEHYGHGAPDDWLERHLYTPYNLAGVALMLLLDLALFGVYGIIIWAVQMIWIPFWAAGVINGLGHWWGYRNYETTDGSTNLGPLGILIGGEEMHNNHHAFPGSAKFSLKRWEFDIGWMYLSIFRAAGLVRIKKLAPKPVFDPSKDRVDLETARAVVVGRLHLMAQFARLVMLPVLHDELDKADASCRRLLKRGRRVLVREESRMDARAQNRLMQALQHNETLQTVYEYRVRLQALWARSQGTEKFLAALQEWCAQAEASGIQALQDFARAVRGYSLAPRPVAVG